MAEGKNRAGHGARPKSRRLVDQPVVIDGLFRSRVRCDLQRCAVLAAREPNKRHQRCEGKCQKSLNHFCCLPSVLWQCRWGKPPTCHEGAISTSRTLKIGKNPLFSKCSTAKCAQCCSKDSIRWRIPAQMPISRAGTKNSPRYCGAATGKKRRKDWVMRTKFLRAGCCRAFSTADAPVCRASRQTPGTHVCGLTGA